MRSGLPDDTVVALLPLRGGSKSIPKKNIKLIAGKPLCAWAIEAACRAKSIDQIYVSTDSAEIALTVEKLGLGVKIIERPSALATDEATTESALLHFTDQVQYGTLLTIQATSPQLTSVQIDEAVKEYRKKNLDSMLSAVRTKRFFWNDDATPINYDPSIRPRRQEFLGTLMENGAFYITKREILKRYKCRLGGKVGIYEMDESTAIEIDEFDDWFKVESYLLNRDKRIKG